MHQRAIEHLRLYADSLPILDGLSAQAARPSFSGGDYLVLECPIARAAKVSLERVCLKALIFVESSHFTSYRLYHSSALPDSNPGAARETENLKS